MSRYTPNSEPVTGESGYPKVQYRAVALWVDDETGNETCAQHWTHSRAELVELIRAMRGKYGLRTRFTVFAEKHTWHAKGARVEIEPEETVQRHIPREDRVAGVRDLRDALHNRGSN